MKRLLAGLGVVAALVVAVVLLRDATMAVRETMPPGSRTEVVVEADVVREEVHTAHDLTRALVLVCETDVRTEIAGEVEQLSPRSDGTYRFVFSPALSDSEQIRLRGCLQDATVDHLQLEVLRLRRLPV